MPDPWYYKGVKNATKKVEIDLVAKIRKHTDDPKFIKLGDRLEKLREQHEQGLLNSIEFLKMLLELAKEAAAEKEVILEEEVDKGKAALTELFNGVKNTNTPVIVKRIVADIDDIVKIVRSEFQCLSPAKKHKLYKSSINKSIHFVQRSLSSSTRG